MKPEHIHDLQWTQAQAVARQTCAGIFKDGGMPNDALTAFGLRPDLAPTADWSRAVEAIAQVLCQGPDQMAA